MNALEVMESVTALVSLGSLTNERVFYASLNRALSEIGQLAPKRAWETIYHALPMPFVARSHTVKVTKQSPLVLSSDSIHAFSVTAYGEGALSVKIDGENAGEYRLENGTPLVLARTVKECVFRESGEVVLRFTSDTAMYVTAVALYGTPCERSVLYRAYHPYPTAKFAHRFLSFTGRLAKNDKPFDNTAGTVRFSDDALEIAFQQDGIYGVEYYALPQHIDAQNREEEFYAREDALVLVPLLTAYYYALEDGSEMADAFLARYRSAREGLVAGKDDTVYDVYGW
ncbi:MAG: hypothetical protein IJW46_05355 [Clostridia bacterium]|nr:hypothetical protein [Clostridia bacterium]